MKQSCCVMRDIMGNYIEGLVSEETAAEIAEHLAECPDCAKVYADMTADIKPAVEADSTPVYNAENVGQVKYLKKYNKFYRALIVVACIGIALSVMFAGMFGMLALMWCAGNERDVTEDAAVYEQYLGKDGKYKQNYLGYNDIFPNKLPDSAKVEKFHCEYYNPWDGNYLSYLVYTCGDEDFTRETARLDGIKSADSYNVYGTTGFPYRLRAVYADEYSGIIYAMSDDENNRLIYVGLEFCNYATDIDYRSVIEEGHLPEGFDAADGNATRQAFDQQEK